MVQTFTALISILGDADSACLSVAVGLTCEGEGECPILGGGILGGGYPPSCVAVGLTCNHVFFVGIIFSSYEIVQGTHTLTANCPLGVVCT